MSVLSNNHYLFTSESVGEGHPDKLCDQVSDAVLDYCLSLDKDAHVACESCGASWAIILHWVCWESSCRITVNRP